MKTMGTPHWYVSGPHSSDYYLLLDEQSEYIFATRLAEHIREASSICDVRAGLATASLLEMWVDDAQRHVWYVFEQVATPREAISIDSQGLAAKRVPP